MKIIGALIFLGNIVLASDRAPEPVDTKKESLTRIIRASMGKVTKDHPDKIKAELTAALIYNIYKQSLDCDDFVTRYCMQVPTINNGTSSRAGWLYNAIHENEEIFLEHANNKIKDTMTYQELKADFERRLEEAGVFWITAEGEARMWATYKGKRD